MTAARLRLALAAALFLGWMGWLGYAALTKSRGPVVSRASAAVATHPVVAEVVSGEDGKPAAKVKVVESLRPTGPPVGAEVEVVNLPAADGFTGPGQYLLLLVQDRGSDAFVVAGRQRSAGYESAGGGRPVVYPWAGEVPAQARALFP